MEQSESIVNLTKALMVFSVKIDTIKFDSNNPFFKSKYASLTHILQTIKDPLIESGLVVTQFPTESNGLVTMLIHAETGEYIRSTYYMTPEKNTPQAHGSVVTYQRRYCVQSILNLNFDNDDDANTASHGSPAPQQSYKMEKPVLKAQTEMFDKAVEKINKGLTTIEKIKEVCKVTPSVEKMLIALTTEK